MMNRVVVTGASAITSMGCTWPEISARLQSGESCIRYMTEWDIYPDLRTRLGSPVDNFELPSHYTRRQSASMGRVAQMAVSATEQALLEADLLADPILKSGRAGVSYGSSTGNSAAALEFFELLENQSMDRMNTTTYLRMMSHTAAVNISVFFKTTGRVYTTTSACAAGSQGIGYAFEAIRNGQQDVMLAGGAEELCPTQAAVFDTILAASTNNQSAATASRPFDATRDGLILGEGACTLVLENREHALKRGATILAEVVGFGTNSDGAHLVRPQPSTMAQVMTLALADAELDPSHIGYVCAHGTATEHGDIAESNATLQVFGEHTAISSLKSFNGHSLGACGAIEAWCSIMMMREGWLAPTANLDVVDERCGKLDYIQHTVREIKTEFVMSNNFAFGGINTSLIFRNPDESTRS